VLTFGMVSYGFLKTVRKSKSRIGNEKDIFKKYSIVIPFRNEVDNLDGLLASLARLDYPLDHFELIFVNDHSEDEGATRVMDFIQDYPKIDVQLVNSSGAAGGKKNALKVGIGLAKYDYILCTDADCQVSQKWIHSINNTSKSAHCMIVAPVTFLDKSGFLAAFQQLDFFALQGTGFGTIGLGKATLNNAANLAFPKNAYLKVGGYDEHQTPSGDDIFLLEKFANHNIEIIASAHSDSIVSTTSETSWSGLLNQRVRWSSKAKFYKNGALVYLGILTVFQNLLMLFFYSGALLVEKYACLFIILGLSKWLIDFILLFLVASFFEKKKALFYLIPVQLMYPFYIVLVWILSLTVKYEWKGRTFNG